MKISKKYLIILSLILILCGGCRKNEFSLSASLPESINHTYAVSYYANDSHGGMEIEAALNLQAGKGELQCATRNPSLGWIFYHNSPIPAAIFYAERGDKISMTGETENPAAWSIGGNKVNELLTEWRLANRALLEKQADNYRLSRPDTLLAKKINSSIADFIKKNPDSAASVLLLGVYYDASADPKGEREMIKTLIASEILDKYSYLIARQDRDYSTIPELPEERLRPQELYLQSYGSGCDTLRISRKGVPMMIAFSKISSPERKEMLDTIRRMARLRGDSAGFVIVDYQVGAEESQWRYSVRRDSLKGVLHAIAVRGLAEDNLRKLQVSELPCWLIIDKEGRILYRGLSTAEAMKSARTLLPQK